MQGARIIKALSVNVPGRQPCQLDELLRAVLSEWPGIAAIACTCEKWCLPLGSLVVSPHLGQLPV